MMWVMAALAADVRLGAQISGGADLPGATDGATAGAGIGLAVPLRWTLGPAAYLRVQAEVFAHRGSDRVEWREVGVNWYSDAHTAMFAGGGISLGPEFDFAPARVINPYVSVLGGAAVVGNWHRFEGGTASLHADDAPRLDALQLAPTVGGHFGARIGKPSGVAVEVEAGYTVSFLPEAPLGEVPAAFGASRTALTLDRARLALGVSAPL